MAPLRAVLFQPRRNPALNTETGSSCPITSCPDNYGSMPSCAGLAVPYVPFQQNGAKKYSQSEALSNGTLFPGLNLPFHLKTEGSALPSDPLVELQALEFVVLELGTYLDTHPDDMEAFDLFKQYAAMEKAAKETYEAKFGPLMKSSAASGASYRWLQDPWPWNYQQNEVK
jgi:spore coat protein JB